MTFSDIFKKSFLSGYVASDLSTTQIVIVLGITALISLYIFFCYRLMTRRTFYSKSFNISLVALAVITAGIIITIQSSVVVSLGMVGALSIVRFRTAIKEPMDLVFLFWSIGIGIMCGAGLFEIAIWVSLAVTFFLIVLDLLPMGKAPNILIIGGAYSVQTEIDIKATLKLFTRYYVVKSQSISNGELNLVIELQLKENNTLLNQLQKIDGVSSVSLLQHNGEVTF